MAPLTEKDVDFPPTPPQAKSTIESLGDEVGVKITTVSEDVVAAARLPLANLPT